MKNEKIKEAFIKELATFITDYYDRSEGYYYPTFIEFIEEIMYDTYLNDLQEENPDTDIDLEEAEENYEMDMEDFEFYVENYLITRESWEEIVKDVGRPVINEFLKEYNNFDDDGENLFYYEPLGIKKHIQLRFEHPQDFFKVVKNRKYVWRKQLSEKTAYNWLKEDGIFKYFKELKITDDKLFNVLFGNVFYDLCEAGQLYREKVIKF